MTAIESRETGIAGAHVLTLPVHGPPGRNVAVWYEQQAVSEALGRDFLLGQANLTVSGRGVVRGIKYVASTAGPAKVVACLAGHALDVVVDLREGSPTFGRWEAVELRAEQPRAVVITAGLGHATLALTEGTVMGYLLESSWHAGTEQRLDPCDTDLGIAWPATVPLLLSDAESTAPSLAAARRGRLLPHIPRTGAAAPRTGV